MVQGGDEAGLALEPRREPLVGRRLDRDGPAQSCIDRAVDFYEAGGCQVPCYSTTFLSFGNTPPLSWQNPTVRRESRVSQEHANRNVNAPTSSLPAFSSPQEADW